MLQPKKLTIRRKFQCLVKMYKYVDQNQDFRAKIIIL